MSVRHTFLLIVGIAFLAGGCSLTRPALQPAEISIQHTEISSAIPDAPEVDSLVHPYRDSLEKVVSRIIGMAEGRFTKGKPESSLGNLVADALLEEARLIDEDTVHFAVTNSGGLRIPSLGPGPIRIEQIYELMPFENMIVILTLTSAEVDSLAQQIAARGGEPVSGITFRITPSGQAFDIRIGGVPLQAGKLYRVATIDYLANGGGNMPALWSPQARKNTTVRLRDAIIHYIERRYRRGEAIRPRVEGRIQLVQHEEIFR